MKTKEDTRGVAEILTVGTFAATLFAFSSAAAADPSEVDEAPGERAAGAYPPSPAPLLPLHSIEGVGGVGLTEMAYLVNPTEGDGLVGLPSLSGTHILPSHEFVDIATVSETLFRRLELSYAFQYVGLGDFPADVKDVLGVELSSGHLEVHNFNARLLLLNDGEFGVSWLPALTAGLHYKHNATTNDFDRDLGGALTGVVGLDDNEGYEAKLTVAVRNRYGLHGRARMLLPARLRAMVPPAMSGMAPPSAVDGILSGIKIENLSTRRRIKTVDPVIHRIRGRESSNGWNLRGQQS